MPHVTCVATVAHVQVWRAIGVNPYREVPADPVEEETVVGNDWPRVMGYMGFLYTRVLGGEQPSIVMYSHKDWFMRCVWVW